MGASPEGRALRDLFEQAQAAITNQVDVFGAREALEKIDGYAIAKQDPILRGLVANVMQSIPPRFPR